jgi:predicted RNA-binding Zn ribbon-like protein
VRCPASIRTTDSDHIRRLRDAISQVCRACATNTPLHHHTVATINTYAAAAPAAPVATLHPYRPPTLNHIHVGTAIGITLAQIASAAIELITGPDRALLRICAGHDCSLLFLKHHSRRRWCHDGCGHRDRQARYYQRTTTTG